MSNTRKGMIEAVKIEIISGILHQWDVGRRIRVVGSEETVSEIHFAHHDDESAIVVEPSISGENITANIPNVLLQSEEDIAVYLVNASNGVERTIGHRCLHVVERPKPADYVYTETEVLTYKTLEERIANLEDAVVDEEQIADAVKEYLEENPIEGGNVTEEQISQAVEAYMEENPVDCGISPVEKTEDMTQPVGIDENGQLWVAPIGGGDTPVVPGSHGIIWDLVNVSSSNNAVSVADGGSLVAVLTANEGYTIGDVTITMGGEAVTGAWNSDTSTIIIASVTGDLFISCVGEEITTADTSPVVIFDDAYTDGGGTPKSENGMFVTEFPLPETLTKYGLKYYTPYKQGDGGNPYIQIRMDDTFVTAWKQTTPLYAEGDTTARSATLSKQYGDYNKIRMTVYKSCQDYSYAYWDETGEIIFAGKLSPYCGMADIYGTPAGGDSVSTEMTVDEDYAMDYGVSIASIVTDDAETKGGKLDTAFAKVIEDAKNQWLSECNGNIDKIPLIVHTDQHGRFNKPLWDFLNRVVDWYDVGKVINLGDVVSGYSGDLLSDGGLEGYVAAMKSVPHSKRIEVFGNHDVMGASNEETGKVIPQHYLAKYFRNIYARRADNYGNLVVYDDAYNVKYLAVSGSAHDLNIGGYSNYIINPDSIRWIIAELEKADGYDVIICSHVPLNQTCTPIDPTTGEDAEYKPTASCGLPSKKLEGLWGGRKNKTAGTFTDVYGTEYAYDFTKCNSDLLCSLHGHQHEDSYYYTDDTLLSVCFDAYYIAPNAIHFVIVDKENRLLNVWKVDNTPQYQQYQIPMDKPAE